MSHQTNRVGRRNRQGQIVSLFMVLFYFVLQTCHRAGFLRMKQIWVYSLHFREMLVLPHQVLMFTSNAEKYLLTRV